MKLVPNKAWSWILKILVTILTPLVDNFLDHYYLNDTTGLESPTSDAIAQWIFEQLEEARLLRTIYGRNKRNLYFWG